MQAGPPVEEYWRAPARLAHTAATALAPRARAAMTSPAPMPPTDNLDKLDKLSWTQGDKTGTCVATNARGLVASLRAGGANVFDGVHIDIKMGRMSCCASCVLLCDMRWHTWSRVGVRCVRLPSTAPLGIR